MVPMCLRAPGFQEYAWTDWQYRLISDPALTAIDDRR